MMELADLEAFRLPWKSIEDAHLRTLENEHGECMRRELRPGHAEPADDLPLRDSQRLELPEQPGGPCPRCQHRRARLVTAAVGLNLDAMAVRLPASHGFVLAHFGAQPACQRHMRNDSAFRAQKTRFGLVDRFKLGWQPPRRKSASDLAGSQYLMRQPMRQACLFGSLDDPPRRSADVEPAG